jgi:hypothetical protein
MKQLISILGAVMLAACASNPSPTSAPTPASATAATTQAQSGGALGQDLGNQPSAACLAAKLRAAEPLPVSLIPEAVLRQARSGTVTVRYDVVAGKAANAKVVASEPAGLYDAYALRYASTYTEPTGATVAGCIMHTSIKF